MGDLRDGHAPEEAQLDDPALPLIQRREALQRLFPVQQVRIGVRAHGDHFARCDSTRLSAALGPLGAARVVDEYLPHGSGGDSQNVHAAFPVRLRLADQPQEHLADQRGPTKPRP